MCCMQVNIGLELERCQSFQALSKHCLQLFYFVCMFIQQGFIVSSEGQTWVNEKEKYNLTTQRKKVKGF